MLRVTPPLHWVDPWLVPSWHSLQPTRWYTEAWSAAFRDPEHDRLRLPDGLCDGPATPAPISGVSGSAWLSSSTQQLHRTWQYRNRRNTLMLRSNTINTIGLRAAFDHATKVSTLYTMMGCWNLGSTNVRVNSGYLKQIYVKWYFRFKWKKHLDHFWKQSTRFLHFYLSM